MSQDLKLLARYVDGGDRLDDHMSQQLYAREKKTVWSASREPSPLRRPCSPSIITNHISHRFLHLRNAPWPEHSNSIYLLSWSCNGE